jgi:hypothetical protein
VTRDGALDASLRDWLTSDEHDVNGWEPVPPLETLHCHPDLVERLTEIARPVRGVCRSWVDGCPVVHHPAGAPIACARGTNWLVVRSGRPAGALAPARQTEGLGPPWVDLDPWAADVTFAKTLEMLRAHVRAAYDRAESNL